MLGRLRKRGADTVTAFGGIPAANVLNICWHGSPLLDDTGGFSSHSHPTGACKFDSLKPVAHSQGFPGKSQSDQLVRVKMDINIW